MSGSADGGATWNDVATGKSADSWINRIRFFDGNTGWLAGDGNSHSSTSNGITSIDLNWGYLMKTSDGGSTWSNVKVDNDTDTSAMYDVSFVDTLNGWIGGNDGRIYRTIDGGATWQKQTTNVTQNITNIRFLTLQDGWATTATNLVLHTTDGGLLWSAAKVGGTDSNGTDNIDSVAAPVFLDAQNAWIVGARIFGSVNKLYKTSDGGQSWTEMPNAPSNISSLYFSDSSVGWALTGYTGELFKTIDGGASWTSVVPGVSGLQGTTNLTFVTPNLAWMSSILDTSANQAKLWSVTLP